MAHPVTHPDANADKFSGLNNNEDPEKFITLVENRILFSLGPRPVNNNNNGQDIWDGRQKALFASLLPGPADEWANARPAED